MSADHDRNLRDMLGAAGAARSDSGESGRSELLGRIVSQKSRLPQSVQRRLPSDVPSTLLVLAYAGTALSALGGMVQALGEPNGVGLIVIGAFYLVVGSAGLWLGSRLIVVIPAVVFTDPELAWCGLTEAEAKERGLKYEVAKFPWAASGRALSFDRTDGVTKMIVDPESERVLGVGVCGAGAGELIAEAVVAIEMGATAEDIALSVHPHPTLSETLMEAAEVFYGHATHTMAKRKAEGGTPKNPNDE